MLVEVRSEELNCLPLVNVDFLRGAGRSREAQTGQEGRPGWILPQCRSDGDMKEA